jgi:dimethylsulfoniopropionate demethylase
MSPQLAISRRTRSTPWTSRVEAAGVAAYSVYNHVLLPASFRGVEADYEHLRRAVQVWDVGCERQTELVGPDAGRLAQMLSMRDLSKFDVGRCGYAPVCDHDGKLLNDPVILRVGEDRWWFSAADSDIALWAGGLAYGLELDVAVCEAEVSPLAVQGPLAEQLTARVLGDVVRDIKFFRSAWVPFRGHPLVVSRTGWSAQGGFEIYVDDAEVGQALYDELFERGSDLDVGPGCPNLIERIEAGLLSYGNDMTREHSPLEAGLDRYCSLDAPIDAIGIEALRAERAAGIRRRICGVEVSGPRLVSPRQPWPVANNQASVGQVTSLAWSPRLAANVALAMVDTPHDQVDCSLTVHTPDGERSATVVALPFPGAVQR